MSIVTVDKCKKYFGSRALFEQVSFVGTKMGNEYQLCTVVIDVTVQAVQMANNGESVLEAIGWPAD